MRSVQAGPLAGLLAAMMLLALLDATVGLTRAGWVVGTTCALVLALLLLRGLKQAGLDRLSPADRVTLSRATLTIGITALVAGSFAGPNPVTVLVALSVLALIGDWIDGWIARRTNTASDFGAQFDMEVDAFLILVLSLYVAPIMGGWVLAIGLARYAFVGASWVLPWMRRPLPPRYWRKVVAATAGIVLTFAAAQVAPRGVGQAVLLVALALLAESFGRDLWWLFSRRGDGRGTAGSTSGLAGAPDRPRSRVRIVASWAVTAAASVLVWFALVAPSDLGGLTPWSLLRIPLEGLLIIGLALMLRPRARLVTSVTIGVFLGLLTILKALDLGFLAALGRAFNPLSDWRYFGSAVGLLSDSVGQVRAVAAVVAAGLAATALLILLPISVLRMSERASRHRTNSARAVAGVGVLWLTLAVVGVQLVAGTPVASTSATRIAYEQVVRSRAEIRDQRSFTNSTAATDMGGSSGGELLAGLRGKDVIIAFVESYGRVAVEGSKFSPGIDRVLDQGTARLRAAGFAANSAYLTSPTFGGLSWLAHSTLQSGLRINTQQRYDSLILSDRVTLTDAFGRAGWRTVADVPSNERDWPEGRSFYHFDTIYDDRNVGYAGPAFGYASMPDQYVLSAFQRLELAKRDRPAVMAEIDLVSSHTPWTPLPELVDWDQVGDGSGFAGMAGHGPSQSSVWKDPAKVRAAYGKSIEYSLSTLMSFVETYGDDNLVLVVLGDHQPATIVSGAGANHDVPVTIIAHDPEVMARVAGWGWKAGLRPAGTGPVWPMEDFRDRFLAAFAGQPPLEALAAP